MAVETLIAKAIEEVVVAKANNGLPEKYNRRPAEMGVSGQVSLVRSGLKFATEPKALIAIHEEAFKVLGVSRETTEALMRALFNEPRG